MSEPTEGKYFLSMTVDHCHGTPLSHALRELVTNAVDADPKMRLADVAKLESDFVMVIANRSIQPMTLAHLLQGSSVKKGSDRYFGGFGCGLKDALCVFVRSGVRVRIFTELWCGEVVTEARPLPTQFGGGTPELCVHWRSSTAADKEFLASRGNGDVAFELTDAKKGRLKRELATCDFLAMENFTPLPAERQPLHGQWLVRKAGPRASHMRVSIRGLYWVAFALKGELADLVFKLDVVSPTERDALGRDRKNLTFVTIKSSAQQALKHLVERQFVDLPASLQHALRQAAMGKSLHSDLQGPFASLIIRKPAVTPNPPGTSKKAKRAKLAQELQVLQARLTEEAAQRRSLEAANAALHNRLTAAAEVVQTSERELKTLQHKWTSLRYLLQSRRVAVPN